MLNLQASNLFSVQGRVVVIIGGGSEGYFSRPGPDYGQAIAINGASKTFVLGRREDALRETAAPARDGVIIPIKCDITSKESLVSAYQALIAHISHVDILFANGDILGPLMRPPLPKADGTLPSLSEIRDLLAAALGSQQEATHAAGRCAYGSTAQVIKSSSIAGFHRKVPFSYAYNASKAATTHIVKMLATNLSSYDIRLNGLAPGLYDSDMANNGIVESGVQGGGISEGSFPRDMIPLTRSGSEEDFAGLIIWLASNSGGYVNGAVLLSDGGRVSVVPNTY